MCAFTIGAALAGLLRSLQHDFASWEKNASLADMEKLRQALKTESAGYEKGPYVWFGNFVLYIEKPSGGHVVAHTTVGKFMCVLHLALSQAVFTNALTAQVLVGQFLTYTWTWTELQNGSLTAWSVCNVMCIVNWDLLHFSPKLTSANPGTLLSKLGRSGPDIQSI